MKCTAIIKNLVPSLISGTILVSSPMVLACDNYSYSTCSICDTVDSFEELLRESAAVARCVLKDFSELPENEEIDDKTTKALVTVCGFVFEICNNLSNYFKNVMPNLLNNVDETVPINIENLHSLYNDVLKDNKLTYDNLSSDMLALVKKLNQLSHLSKTISLESKSQPLNLYVNDFERMKNCYSIMLDISNILDEKDIRHHVCDLKILQYSDKFKNNI